MDVGHEVISERADRRSGAWAGLRQLAGLWRVFLFTELAWLIISVVVLRFAPASVAIMGVLVGVTVMLGASEQFLLMADPPIMERVIVNLAGNALRYSPAGSPLLLTAGACGDRVELRFVDRGPGIPEAERDRAFMPFQRLGDTSRTTGVGLGLTVSRGLTEAMGGTLKPEETPGGGLTMAISLPAVPSPVAGQDGVELVAGADGELGEDLVQVVFDRARAHE